METFTHPIPAPAADRAVPAIEVRGVSKRFGGALALEDVSFTVGPGERHAVVGENGAGKSTMMRIIAGILHPDSGEVRIGGNLLEATTRSAIEAGVALVHQELSLVPELSVAENIALGSTPTRFGFVRRRKQREIALAALRDIGVELDVDEPVARLSMASRQFVEIARAVASRPRVLILDEPTATLTPAETDHLLKLLVRLSDQGISLLYISHRMPEVFSLCSRATVLRDGRKVADLDLTKVSTQELIDKMVGRELAKDLQVERIPVFGDVVLSAKDIYAPKVNGVSLEVRAGEIVGIGGLVGAGRSELIRAVLGADPRTSGSVTIARDGRKVPLRSYSAAVSNGVAFIPEERRSDGLALTMSVRDNVALPSRKDTSTAGVLRRGEMARLAEDIVNRVGLHPADPNREAGQFSGGNQQKIVIGKWLATKPRLVVLDEPTRGVDVGAKAEIHRIVRGLADQGAAVLVVSSDLPELLDLSDTIHVVRDGRLVGTLDRGSATERSVMTLAAGKD